MLTTLGFIALLIGIVLIIAGYTAAPQAIRPGWAASIIGALLLILGYTLPAHSGDEYHTVAHTIATA